MWQWHSLTHGKVRDPNTHHSRCRALSPVDPIALTMDSTAATIDITFTAAMRVVNATLGAVFPAATVFNGTNLDLVGADATCVLCPWCTCRASMCGMCFVCWCYCRCTRACMCRCTSNGNHVWASVCALACVHVGGWVGGVLHVHLIVVFACVCLHVPKISSARNSSPNIHLFCIIW